MIAASDESPADWILEIGEDGALFEAIDQMVCDRRLSAVVKALNRDVLDGASTERDRAIAALERFPDSPLRRALTDIADFVVTRSV
jgi:geranylgeranyl pyrophosphate synthase